MAGHGERQPVQHPADGWHRIGSGGNEQQRQQDADHVDEHEPERARARGGGVITEEARRFSARVQDVHEWLATRIDDLPEGAATSSDASGPDASGSGTSGPGVGDGAQRLRIAVQDPCHLRHVQQAHLPVREVLGRYFDVVELDDDGLCCGAGGAYSQQHPEVAGAVRERKVAAIERTGAGVVASANPGCTLHLQAAGLDVRHPLEIVAEHLDGGTQA